MKYLLAIACVLVSGCTLCQRHPIGCTAAAGVIAVGIKASLPHRHGQVTCGAAMHGDVLLPPGGVTPVCQ